MRLGGPLSTRKGPALHGGNVPVGIALSLSRKSSWVREMDKGGRATDSNVRPAVQAPSGFEGNPGF